MAFDKEELEFLHQLRSDIAFDTRTIVTETELRLGKRIDQVAQMESGDIQAAYKDIDVLKKTVKSHDHRIAVLER